MSVSVESYNPVDQFRAVSSGGFKGSLYSEPITVPFKSALIVHDLHLTNRFKGSHKDYGMSCLRVMGMILDKVRAMRQQYGRVSLHFTGDLYGEHSKVLYDPDFRYAVYEWWRVLNAVCDVVTSVYGNHCFDVKATERDITTSVGYVSNPTYIDFTGESGDVVARLHSINYSDERKEIEILDSTNPVSNSRVLNLAIAHVPLMVPGETPMYLGSRSVDATTLTNLEGLDAIIMGDIHEPYPEWINFYFFNGKHECTLINPGSPTRVKQRIDDVYEVRMVLAENDNVQVSMPSFGLWSAEEEFLAEEETFEDSLSQEELDRRTSLAEVIANAKTGATRSGADIRESVANFPQASEQARSRALSVYDSVVETTNESFKSG